MAKNYYEVLGVKENATKDEIAKSFKKLSLKWHPDRWVSGSDDEKKRAEEKFKEIAEAYSVLSDDQKRDEYDNGGQNPFAGSGFNPFEGFNPFGDFGYQNRGPMPGPDSEAYVEITLEESYSGVSKTITYKKSVACKKCNGTGSADGKTHDCPHCHGTGYITKTTQRGFMTMQQTSPCPHCKGSGKSYSKPCSHCNGSGVEYVTVQETVKIPRGIQNGMTINLQGKGGDSLEGGPSGDLKLRVSVKNNTNFTLSDFNLIYYDKVNFVDALLGYEKSIKCIDGSTIKIKVNELTKDNSSIIYKGKGMPIMNHLGKSLGFGDLAVVVSYTYPNKLSTEQKKLLETFKNLK